MGIQVRAFREGFYKGERKRVGDEFPVPDGQRESDWFAPVDAGVKLQPRPTREEKAVARKKAEESRRRQRIDLAREKALKPPAGKPAPVALSQVHQREPARVAQAAGQAPEDGPEQGNEPLA
jgi:hypothetical protein